MEDLLKEDTVCQIPLPRLLIEGKLLEDSGQLTPRQSPIIKEIEEESDRSGD